MDSQPFEKHKELTESILFAAHNWQISTGWTNHLEQINKVCIQNEELLEMLTKISLSLEHFNPPSKELALNWAEEINQLITKATT